MKPTRNARRRFLLAAGLLGAISAGHGQGTPPMRRVAVFSPSVKGRDEAFIAPFYEEMRRLGWVEARNLAYDRVYGDDNMEGMAAVAAAIVARKPDLIVAIGPPTAIAVARATSSIPIVFAVVVDPIAAGLVKSFARPGGNVTGVTQSIAESLAPKRIELLREILPDVRRIELLGNTLDPGSMADQAAIAPLVRSLGLTLVVANATNPAEFDASVESLVDQRVQAILVANGIAVSRRLEMTAITNRARIPVVAFNAPMAEAGALLSFGPSMTNQIRYSARLADRILRGATPAEVPVEAADQIELVVNARNARALGIAIPRSVQLRANRTIE